MKKVLFSLFFIMCFAFPALADYTVDSVSVYAEVSSNGKADVTASYTVTFLQPAEEITVPLPDSELSGVSADSFRYRVRQTENGTNVIISTGKGFSGTQTFTVNYKLPAFTYDGTSQDLYRLNLLSSRWAREVGTLSAQVILPDPYGEMPQEYTVSPQILSGYFGDLDAVDATLEVSGNVITGSVSDRMAYDSLTLQVTLPDGYFRVRSSTIPMIAITWFCLVMAAVTGLCILYWNLKLRTRSGSYTARLLSPEGILPYQLPQMLDGYTVDMAALILEWANLGYLSLGYSRDRHVVLRRNLPMGSERSRAEQQLFSAIFSGGNRVIATPGRFSPAARRFRAASRKSVARFAFDPKGGNSVLVQLPCRLLLAVAVGYLVYMLLPEGPGFMVLAVAAGIPGFVYSMYLHSTLALWRAQRQGGTRALLMLLPAAALMVLGLLAGALPETTVGVFACCFSALATAPGPRRSDWGQEILAQTKGCRRFYRHASWHKLQIYMGHNNRFFQLQLPKAVALNSDKAFAARFERLSVPQPEWLPGLKKRPKSAADLQKTLSPMVKKLREAFR